MRNGAKCQQANLKKWFLYAVLPGIGKRTESTNTRGKGGGGQNGITVTGIGQFIGIGVRRSMQEADNTFDDGVGYIHIDRDIAIRFDRR